MLGSLSRNGYGGNMHTDLLDLAMDLFENCAALEEECNPGFWIPTIACLLEDIRAHRDADELARMAFLECEEIELPRMQLSNKALGLVLGLWTSTNYLDDDAPGWEWAQTTYLGGDDVLREEM